MPIDDILPKESGRFKYVIFRIENKAGIHIGATSQGHSQLVQDFFCSRGATVRNVDVVLNFPGLGGIGGGILDWDIDQRRITYYLGCRYGPDESTGEIADQLRSAISELMQGSNITYDTPLTELPIESQEQIGTSSFVGLPMRLRDRHTF